MLNKQSWQEIIMPEASTIKNVIQVLNDVGLRIVLITSEVGIFIGTISDGDVRRGLLQGLNLESPIESIIHRDALVVNLKTNRESVVHLMTQNKIQQIPVVDEKMQLIGLHLWDELVTPIMRTNTMIIMAGGKGSRLHPQTENCPKPMLPIAGKPILQHIIERAKQDGISNFILAIHYLGHLIEDYFGNGEKFGVKIDYIREMSPLGTAGALGLLENAPTSAFIVTNGDVISEIRYGEILDFHRHEQAKATMAVRAHEFQNPFGVVQIEGIEISGFEEKPLTWSYINAGVYVLDPSVLELVPKHIPCDMPELFKKIKEKEQRLVAFPIHEQWLDVGHPKDLEYIRSNFKSLSLE